MGTFSKYHRYREAGEEANVVNTERFGEPKRSLFTSTKVFTLHHEISITDDSDKVVYSSQSQFFSLRDKTDVFNETGLQIAHIERKPISFHQTHFVTMYDGKNFELNNELFHLIDDIINIDGLGWQLRGNILGLNFELYGEYENIIAVISQKFFSIHDRYCIDIYQTEYEEYVIAILVTLQHMIRDREASSSSSSSSSNEI
ncbi:MAG: hypothetical protein IKF68_01375 [Erysipelotrichaceae bacterium]|nr:hypothetical protein [Erysipelotrichaceae bacterium]